MSDRHTGRAHSTVPVDLTMLATSWRRSLAARPASPAT